MAAQDIDHHIFETYRTLRFGIAGLAFAFPFTLVVLGYFAGLPTPANSWSAYYHLSPLTRDVFVGVLWAIGIFFILYKGYSNTENFGLYVAGFFAICVALIPMNKYDAGASEFPNLCNKNEELNDIYRDEHVHQLFRDKGLLKGERISNLLAPITDENTETKDESKNSGAKAETRGGAETKTKSEKNKEEYLVCNTSLHFHTTAFGKALNVSFHGLSAVIFFISAAIVAIFTSAATLPKLPYPEFRRPLRVFYIFSGLAMFGIPIALVVINEIGNPVGSLVFLIETAGLIAFLCYWIVKTIELMFISDELILNDPNLLKGMNIRKHG